MKVSIGENVYLVKFNHVQEGINVSKSKLSKREEKIDLLPVRHTECKILLEQEDKDIPGFVGIGYSRCHPNDNFNKETGRQLSLKKALEDGEFDKDTRTIFWDNYRSWGLNPSSIIDQQGNIVATIPATRF